MNDYVIIIIGPTTGKYEFSDCFETHYNCINAEKDIKHNRSPTWSAIPSDPAAR